MSKIADKCQLVHTIDDATIQGEARTNNACEAWNNGFKHLVGHSNPSLWSVITCLQKDNAIVETDVFRHTRGESIARRVRKGTVVHQKRMAKLCSKVASGSMSVVDFLEAVGRSIRLHIWHSLHLTWVYIYPCVNCFAYADIYDIYNLLHFVNSVIDSIYIFVWIVASICLYL